MATAGFENNIYNHEWANEDIHDWTVRYTCKKCNLTAATTLHAVAYNQSAGLPPALPQIKRTCVPKFLTSQWY
jgi:hypothetical protein